MPEAMERALKATARKRGYGKKRAGAYIYGTMREKTSWVPSTQKKRVARRKKKKKVIRKKRSWV